MTRFNRLSIIAILLAAACTSPDSYEPWELETLTGTRGFTLMIPEFEVPSGRESQNCYFVRVPDNAGGNDLWINRVAFAINPGSHHVNIFRVKTILGLDPAAGTPTSLGDYDATVIEGSDDVANSPCWNSSNWADWPLVSNSQNSEAHTPVMDWQLPPNVAIRFHPGDLLMVQTHYVNSTDQPTPHGARVGINFYNDTITADPIEMGSLFATQQNIRVCRSNPQVTYSGTCRFPNGVTIEAANGHFHKRGDEFRMYPWDGRSTAHPDELSQFYLSTTWDHPPMARDLALPAPANTGVWWDCAYKWKEPSDSTCDEVDAKDPLKANDCCYTFGGNTDVGEHCNMFMYYYPRLDTDVFCL